MYYLACTCVKSRFPRLGAPIPPLDGFLHDNVHYTLAFDKKPIKITVRRTEQEPVNFVQKIRIGTTEEEAEEEPAEALERHAPKRS